MLFLFDVQLRNKYDDDDDEDQAIKQFQITPYVNDFSK